MLNELYHHGILGQKWGIRRYQNADGTLTPKGKKRYDKLTGSRKEAKLEKKLKKLKKLKQKYGIYEKNGKSFVNNRMMNNRMMNNTIRQANQHAMEQANRAAINASLQAASLSMSGGMNPFMFGMM